MKPIDPVGTLLQALERRSNLDTERVDDTILGVVDPLGEQGSVLPKSAALDKAIFEKRTESADVPPTKVSFEPFCLLPTQFLLLEATGPCLSEAVPWRS